MVAWADPFLSGFSLGVLQRVSPGKALNIPGLNSPHCIAGDGTSGEPIKTMMFLVVSARVYIHKDSLAILLMQA